MTREHPSKVLRTEEPPLSSPSFGQQHAAEELKEVKIETEENVGPMRVEGDEAGGPSGEDEKEEEVQQYESVKPVEDA